MHSVAQRAGKIGVSQPAPTCFSQALGCNRYQEFQSAFQNLLLAELNTVDGLIRIDQSMPPCVIDYVFRGVKKVLLKRRGVRIKFWHELELARQYMEMAGYKY
jgi:DNA-binding MurR/RpiR family transcriptional regulator